MLFVNTAVLLFAYLLCVRFFPLATLAIFSALTTVVAFSYVIYNRGFSRKGLKAENLPDSWSDEQKREFIEDGNRRLERSKWVLTLIIPIVIIYAYEVIDIFILPAVAELLGIGV